MYCAVLFIIIYYLFIIDYLYLYLYLMIFLGNNIYI